MPAAGHGQVYLITSTGHAAPWVTAWLTLPRTSPSRRSAPVPNHEQIGGTALRHVENSAGDRAFHDLCIYIGNPLSAQSFGHVAYQRLGFTQRLVQPLAVVGFAQEIGHRRKCVEHGHPGAVASGECSGEIGRPFGSGRAIGCKHHMLKLG